MNEKSNRVGGDVIVGNAPNSKNTIIGKDIKNIKFNEGGMKIEIDILNEELDKLKTQIHAQASIEKRELAVDLIDEFETNISLGKPIVGIMQKTKKWFLKHLPSFAGRLIRIFGNPILGKIVKSTGEIAADEFKRLFGEES